MSAAHTQRRVVVLISGRGSNMRALVESGRETNSPYQVVAVLADGPQAPGLATAGDLGIETGVIAPRPNGNRDSYAAELAAEVGRRAPDLIALAGFMRILAPTFVDAFAGRILNIHPSLLPKYPGLHTHRRVLAEGDLEHGATVHFVSAQLDAGPAVLQGRLDVGRGEDEARLAARVLELEHRLYPLAARWVCEGRLACRDGKAWFDGHALASPLQLAQFDGGQDAA